MAARDADDQSDAPSGWPGFASALLFWLFLPFPYWLLMVGFSGEWMFLPDFWNVSSVIWVVAFYAPPALMMYVVVDSVRSVACDDPSDTR
jgi:uncharacterized membrane protein